MFNDGTPYKNTFEKRPVLSAHQRTKLLIEKYKILEEAQLF